MMVKIILGIDGMMCGMCESHVNQAIRAAFPVKNVTSSRGAKQTVILSETDIPDDELKAVIAKTGYDLLSIHREKVEKKGFFASLRK